MTLDGAAETALTCYRRELARLRDSHQGLWKAQLAASVPGALVLTAWVFLWEAPGHHWSHGIWAALAVALWIGWVIWHDAEKAKQYQRELDALHDAA